MKQKRLTAYEKYQLDRVAVIVKNYYRITKDELFSAYRNNKDYYIPRHIYHYLCRIRYNLPSTKIGFISGRDHASILNSIKRVEEYLTYDKIIIKDVNKLIILLEKGDIYWDIQNLVDDIPENRLQEFKKHIEKFIAA